MPFAISLRASEETENLLKDYWSQFNQFETIPSMLELNYAPHISLLVYEDAPVDRLREVVSLVFSEQHEIRLRFDKLDYFDKPQLVFWASPVKSNNLLALQSEAYKLMLPVFCDQYYRPENWVPHSTLATAVPACNKEMAIAFASTEISSFDIVFDKVDCVEFPPVRLAMEHVLMPGS